MRRGRVNRACSAFEVARFLESVMVLELAIWEPSSRKDMLRGGLHIARLLGIDIYVDWSWLFIFLLITSNLAAGVFPQWHPEWSFWLSWLVAAVAAVLFFVSVLLHELSHSIVARARGMRV